MTTSDDTPGRPGAGGIPIASVDDRRPVARTPAEAHAAARARAVAALAAPAVPLKDCTYGGDCPVHPEQIGLHDMAPGAVEALQAVLIQVRYLPVTENVLRRIVASLGIDFAEVEGGI